MDDHFGLKGARDARARFAKLPCQFFEQPQRFREVYAVLLSALLSELGEIGRAHV